MNMRMNILLIGVALLGHTGVVWAQSDSPIRLKIEALSETIGPLDPLRFNVTVSNQSDTDLTNLPVFAIEENSSVEIKTPGESSWKAISVPFLERMKNRCIDLDQFRFELRAQETKSFEMEALYDPYISYRDSKPYYYFTEPGDYHIRFSYQPSEGTKIVSNEARFAVKPYTGIDQEAYQFLQGTLLPHFVFDPVTYVLVEMHEADEWAHQLVDRFPKSRFAPYAQLYLANCYLLGLRTGREILPPDIAQADRWASGLTNSPDERIRHQAEKLLLEIDQKRKALEEDARVR